MKFDASGSEFDLIRSIAERAASIPTADYKVVDAEMDIEATHCNGCPLDLEKLAGFNDFNFAHDVLGIRRHLNRKTGKLEDFFLPRCARHERGDGPVRQIEGKA